MGFVLSCAAALSAPMLSAAAPRAAARTGSLAREGGADDSLPEIRASMLCEPAESPGRVRCVVEAHVTPGESITWGDVVIVRTPPFATALRGRIGPHDATTRDATTWRWALAVVARERGRGDIEARVRLVVCREGRCTPGEAAVVGRVAVGD